MREADQESYPQGQRSRRKIKKCKLSPWGHDPKRALKINMGQNTIKTNGEDCVLAQILKPEGESLKRSIKTNIGGNKAQPK